MKTKIPDAVLAAEVSRRGLVKTTAIGGLAMASSALTLPFSRIAHAVDSAIPTKSDEKVIWSACTVNCGSRCPLRMHVVDGEIKYVETDNTGDDNYDGLHQVRACLRGRSMRRRVYNPDRLKYPMKRVAARVKVHTAYRLSVCRPWKTRSRPAFRCLCGPMPLNVARK